MNLRRIMTQPAASRIVNAKPLILSSSAFVRPTSTPLQYSLARFLSENLRTKLDEVVKKNNIVVFMKGTPEQPMCGFSRAAVQIFDAQGVDLASIKTLNVLEDEELRSGIKEYSSWPTIPQVYIKGEFIGGTDVLLSMHQSGDLEELLVKEALVAAEPDSASQ